MKPTPRKKSATRKKSPRQSRLDKHFSGERLADAYRVDGNAVGGMFGELFAIDLTGARAKCAGCGASEIVGALLVYAHGMGMIARCPHCEGVVIRMSRTPKHMWLDARGATSITVTVSR
jgi:hypothetical protein